MSATGKKVFISYRRDTSQNEAQLLNYELRMSGYEVFLDTQNVSAGNFSPQLIDSIKQSSFFLLLLGPNTLTRCSQEGDVLRTEIELALTLEPELTILPLIHSGFTFKDDRVQNDLVAAGGILDPLTKKHFEVLDTNDMRGSMTNILRHLGPRREDRNESQFSADTLLRTIVEKLDDPDYSAEDRIRDLSKVITLDPELGAAYVYRGLAFQEIERYKNAIDDYLQAISLDRHDVTAYNNLGSVHVVLGNYEIALLDLTIAIAIEPRWSRPYYHRGIVHQALYAYEQALSDFKNYLDLGGAVFGDDHVVREYISDLEEMVKKTKLPAKFKAEIEKRRASIRRR